MYAYRIRRLAFNDSSELIPGNFTIICGPNNAGKSRILKDIRSLCVTAEPAKGVVVKEIETVLPANLDDLRNAYAVDRHLSSDGWHHRYLDPELCSGGGFSGGGKWPDAYHRFFSLESPSRARTFASNFGLEMVAYLTTEHRLQLVKQSASSSDEHERANLLQALYAAGPTVEKSIRDEVRKAFGREIALDFSAPQTLLLRVGDDFAALPADPRDARPVLIKHQKLDDQGDGLRAFAGVISALLVVNRGLFLIDEPETFLHPPQAFRIGEVLASQAKSSRQLIVATHSVDFVRGVLSKTKDVAIVRVDRDGDQNSFHQLAPTTLQAVVSDPLLSSARVLDGLFYAAAVVVESDRDARFYHSVFKKRFPELDLHFVNADNKQTVPRIVKLYRNLGVKCCGIVDFDALNDGGELKAMLVTLSMAEADQAGVLSKRSKIGQVAKEVPPEQRFENAVRKIDQLTIDTKRQAESMSEQPIQKFLSALDGRCRDIADAAKGWKELKQIGVEALPEEVRPEFWDLFELCAQAGLLITPTGELESMLIAYGIDRTTDKRAWIARALTLIPSLEPDDAKHPWQFVKSVAEHLKT